MRRRISSSRSCCWDLTKGFVMAATAKLDLEKLTQAMAFYCELMQEIKIRDQGIAELSHAPVPAQIAYESAYLQLRMICELIAIACLVVHGDIPATTQKMKKTWEADQIIKRLSEIHPESYPHPVMPNKDDKFRLVAVDSGFLQKSELLHLYGRCGDKLHRGTVKNARHRISPRNVTFTQIQAWREKITRLLQHHWIVLFDSVDQIGVQMGDLGHSPAWNYWKKVEPLPEPPAPDSQT